MSKEVDTQSSNQTQPSIYPNGIYWDFSNDHGPEHWQKSWNFTKRQSPIDIVTQNVQYDQNLKALSLERQSTLIHAKNIGWNVSFQSDNNKAIPFRGGALVHNYAFREMHFHWGEVHDNKCELGCEHTIDGKRYAAEMHVVHWNTDLYQTETEAISNPDGLAVLGVLIDADESYEENKDFEVILEMFSKVPYMNNCASFNVSPYFLFPNNTEQYFTYPGSLTMPPLTENVTWTLLLQPIRISSSQLKRMSENNAREENKTECAFKFKRQSESTTITNNYRLTQPINNRVVRSSFT